MDSGERPGRFGDKPWPGHRSTLCVNSNQSGRPFGMKKTWTLRSNCQHRHRVCVQANRDSALANATVFHLRRLTEELR